MNESEPSEENVFKILIASDTHLGFMDNDPERRDDTLTTFEEILQIASENKVDFILHSGDLFHDNKPSRYCLNSCVTLIRQYCLGERSINFEVVSDQSVNFQHSRFPWVNFEDPNLNVSIPIFTIHGNHDDPTGAGLLSALDVLNSAGLVNYFGKYSSLETVEISPLLMYKGVSKLALFGLGAMKDERLHQMFVKECIQVLRPREDFDDWFNVFVLHQNRSVHGAMNHIPEQFINTFFDLVIWGHEHECRIDAEWNPAQKFYVVQPGSSVVTALAEGEEIQKHVGILSIWKKNFKIKKIPLRSVRQFYMENITLSDISLLSKFPSEKHLELACTQKVEKLLERAAQERSGHPRQPEKPLIRLRVEYQDTSAFNAVRFGQKFVDRIANPKSLIHFLRKPSHHAKVELDKNAEGVFALNHIDTSCVEDLVKKYFETASQEHRLTLLSEKGMGDAIKEYVDKDEKDSIKEFINYQITKAQDYLRQNKDRITEENIDQELMRYKVMKESGTNGKAECGIAALKTLSITNSNEDAADSDMEIDLPILPTRTKTKTVGSKRQRGRGTKATGRKLRDDVNLVAEKRKKPNIFDKLMDACSQDSYENEQQSLIDSFFRNTCK